MAADPVRDTQIAAIEALGEIKSPDPRIDSVLLDGMEDKDAAIRLASLEALRATTGQDMGRDPAEWKKLVEARAKIAAKAESTKR